MAHKYEHVSTAAGFKVLNGTTESTVITQAGALALIDQTADPVAVGQMTYKTGIGFRAYGASGIFTIPTSGGGGGSDTLDSAYENGRAIEVDLGAVVWTDATASTANTMEFVQSGAKTGNILDFAVNATLTGNVIDIDLNSGVGAKAIYIDGGGGTRTAVPFDIKHDGDGNVAAMNITATNTGTGGVFTVSMDGNGSGGGVFNVDMNAAVGAEYLYLDAGAGTRTANLFEIKNDGDGNVDVFSIVDSNTGSGSLFDINMDGVGTGSVMNVDMNAAVGEEFLELDAGGGTRTVNLIEVTNDGDGNVDFLAITDSNTGSGALFDISMDGNGGGSVIDVDMNAAVDEEFLILDGGGGTKTASLFVINDDGDGDVHCFDIDSASTGAGSVMNIDCSATRTGPVFNIDLDAAVDAYGMYFDGGADTRTVPTLYLKHDGDGNVGFIATDVTNTGSGHVIDIAYGNAINTGDAIHIDFVGAAASTGNGLYIDTGTNVAGQAISILTAGARTSPVIYIDGAGTDAGTDDHIIDINQSGQLDSNVLDITYATAASTGNAVDLNMGTNVAGMAVSIGSAATGTSGEGACLDIAHTGNLGAGADVVRIHSTGSISSTSNLLEIVQDTGASTAGANCLYINATGANVEAIRVDAGTVIVDETITATGGYAGTIIGATITATSGAGAIAVTGSSHEVTTTGTGDAMTLANGTAGQKLSVVYVAEGAGADTAVITPTTLAGGATITLTNLGDSADLEYHTTGGWYVMGLGGAASVA